MTPHIAICRSGKTRRGFRLTAPKRHAAMAHLNSIWRRGGPKGSSAIGANVAPMGPAVVVINCTVNSVTNLPAISIRCQFRSGGHARFQLLQKTLRCVANLLQVFPLSAQAMGLAVGVYGQHPDRREMKCPTKVLKDLTK